MNKTNDMRGGYEVALANLPGNCALRDVHLATTPTPQSFARSHVREEHQFYIAAFNHLTPFPGRRSTRLAAGPFFDRWWLDDRYQYNMVPFQPAAMTPARLQQHCLDARRAFYSWPSIMSRGVDPVNRADAFMFRNFFPINTMLRVDTNRRDGYPLGDESWQGQLLRAH